MKHLGHNDQLYCTVYPINDNFDLHAQVMYVVLYCNFSYESSKSKNFFFLLPNKITMAVFKQQQVENFYEIGEELGR